MATNTKRKKYMVNTNPKPLKFTIEEEAKLYDAEIANEKAGMLIAGVREYLDHWYDAGLPVAINFLQGAVLLRKRAREIQNKVKKG